MKIRAGFVANSSSCGFIIPLAWIKSEQVEALMSRCQAPEKENPELLKLGLRTIWVDDPDDKITCDEWLVWVTRRPDGRDCLQGSTMMDNGAMPKLLESLGIPLDAVIYDTESGMEWNGKGLRPE
ncbi:MAG: hypothetical protein ABFE07_28800 [Armatimonadia bacterium]